MKKWTIIVLCVLGLLFLCVTGTGTAGNKGLEEKIVALEKQGWEAIKKKEQRCAAQVTYRPSKKDRTRGRTCRRKPTAAQPMSDVEASG